MKQSSTVVDFGRSTGIDDSTTNATFAPATTPESSFRVDDEERGSLTPKPSSGAQVGLLFGFASDGTPLVELPEQSGLQEAITTLPLNHRLTGRSVVLLFEWTKPSRPIIVGLLPENAVANPEDDPSVEGRSENRGSRHLNGVRVTADGQRVLVTAEREIQLRCGEASITLTHTGKVVIRGSHVLSRSRGANKIKGAYVDIN